ncbi:putative domain XH, zinc finger-XS domain protein [Tanacetum coccineum]
MEIVMKQKDVIIDNFNKGMELMQEKTTKRLENIFIEHKQSERRLEYREKELRAREVVNDTEKRKLDSEKKKNQLAIIEQTKADERMLKLAEDQKLDDRQRLELEIKQIKGALKVREHMTDSKKKKDLIQEDLKEKEDVGVHFHCRSEEGHHSEAWVHCHSDAIRQRCRMQRILAALGYHDNIAGYNNSRFENERLYIQMELCDQSLSINHSSRPCTEDEVLEATHQVYKRKIKFMFFYLTAFIQPVRVDRKIEIQAVIYKLSKVGKAIENNDLPSAGSVLGQTIDADWLKKANAALSQLSSSPEEVSQVETFNLSFTSLYSSGTFEFLFVQ